MTHTQTVIKHFKHRQVLARTLMVICSVLAHLFLQAWSRRLLVIHSVQQSSGFACFQPTYGPPDVLVVCPRPAWSSCQRDYHRTPHPPTYPPTIRADTLCSFIASMTARLFLTGQALWVTSWRPHDHWRCTKTRSCRWVFWNPNYL